MTRSGAAFFDVDDTLLRIRSLFRFLRFHLAASARPDAEYTDVRERIRRMAAGGASRMMTLREYYRSFQGAEEAVVSEHGRLWFQDEIARGGLFHEPVLARLRDHAASGMPIVLVSGSFAACLDPIATYVRSDLLLCTRPQVRHGIYTGLVDAPMIGAEKAKAIRAVVRDRSLDLTSCHAYGDHVSDLPMLKMVGHPTVIGVDRPLRAHAAAAGWPHLTPV